jgi:uncharacterized membrane protein YhaH (DUF805 family)
MTKYFSFLGKANRSEFWAINLIVIFAGWIALIGFLILAGVFAIMSEIIGGMMVLSVFLAWLIGTIWLILAVGVRRCRDADISVFWVIPLAIPVLFLIMTIVLGVLPTVDKNFIPNEKT